MTYTIRSASLLLVGLLVASVVLSGCGSSKASGTIKVGVVANQTTDFALAGQFLLNGIQMAADEINAAGGVKGRNIELVIADAAKDNSTAVNAVNKVLDAKPVAIFAPIYSTQTNAMLPVIKKAPVVTFSAGSAPILTEQGLNFMFRPRPNDGALAMAAVDAVMRKLGKQKIGLIHVNNEYGNGSAQKTKEAAQKLGATVVGDEAYAATDKDFRSQLRKLADQGAEVLLLFGHPGDSALVIKQRKELNLQVPLISGVTIVSPAVISLATPAEMDGIYAVIDQVGVPAKNPGADVQQWVAAYKKRFGSDPDYSSFSYYNTMRLLAKAMESGTDPEALRKAVASAKFTGLGNIPYAFDEKGDLLQSVSLVQFNGADPNVIDSALKTR